jgi:hypothetical protein
MIGVVNSVARCRTWKSIIASFGARQVPIPNQTSLLFAQTVTAPSMICDNGADIVTQAAKRGVTSVTYQDMECGDKFWFARSEDLFLRTLFYLDNCTSIFVLILFLSLTPVGCDRELDLHSGLQAVKNLETHENEEITTVPDCPETPFPMLQSSDPKTGHHKVVLSWKPSAASVDPDKYPVGYCIYRSRKKDVLRRDPTCRECEVVSLKPIRSTDCVDDLVQNDVTYYYVVTAISRHKNLSGPSNQIRAVIPKADRPLNSEELGVHPSCRAPVAGK